MSKIRVADYIAQRLIEHGISDVFMVTGGGAMHLNDAFGNHPGLTYYCNHHEQACAIAAEGYYRATGNMPVVNITTGPGGTNAITGVLGQWLDSIPALYISGQSPWGVNINSCSENLRQLGDQEGDITNVVKPITKYAVILKDPKQTKKILDEAIYIATHGRPGPVWIDIPLDVQCVMVDSDTLEECDTSEGVNEELLNVQAVILIERLRLAKSPVLFVGNGIRLSGSVDLYRELLREIKVPVVTAINGNDLITTDDPLFFGRPGICGDRMGNISVQNSDLIIILGTRVGVRQTTYNYKDFGRNAYKIMVDIDNAELNKPTLKIDLRIHSDLKLFLNILLEKLKEFQKPDFSQWINWGNNLKKQLPSFLDDNPSNPQYVNSYLFVDRLFDLLPNDATVVTGNGTAFTCTLQAMKVKEGMRVISNQGCASMGYDLPAAVGACIGSKKEIILITGDGSIMMNLQELQTIFTYQLPIKIFILENDGYLAIRTTQTTYFDKRFVGESPQSRLSLPVFEKIAMAFNIDYVKIENEINIDHQLGGVLRRSGPVICEIKMNPNQTLYPKTTAEKTPEGVMIPKPMEVMFPLLSKEINIWFNT